MLDFPGGERYKRLMHWQFVGAEPLEAEVTALSRDTLRTAATSQKCKTVKKGNYVCCEACDFKEFA